jgi:hypothetical protein
MSVLDGSMIQLQFRWRGSSGGYSLPPEPRACETTSAYLSDGALLGRR